jgi:hypothetical protein
MTEARFALALRPAYRRQICHLLLSPIFVPELAPAWVVKA